MILGFKIYCILLGKEELERGGRVREREIFLLLIYSPYDQEWLQLSRPKAGMSHEVHLGSPLTCRGLKT